MPVTTHYRLTGCSIRLRGLWEGDKSGDQPVHRRRFVVDTECWAEGPIKEARLAVRANLDQCRERPALYDATDGLPQQWRMLEELDGPTTDAIVFAVARGWMIVEAGHSICLADVGRRLMEIARLDGTPMTRAHARSALKFPDFYAKRKCFRVQLCTTAD